MCRLIVFLVFCYQESFLASQDPSKRMKEVRDEIGQPSVSRALDRTEQIRKGGAADIFAMFGAEKPISNLDN